MDADHIHSVLVHSARRRRSESRTWRRLQKAEPGDACNDVLEPEDLSRFGFLKSDIVPALSVGAPIPCPMVSLQTTSLVRSRLAVISRLCSCCSSIICCITCRIVAFSADPPAGAGSSCPHVPCPLHNKVKSAVSSHMME